MPAPKNQMSPVIPLFRNKIANSLTDRLGIKVQCKPSRSCHLFRNAFGSDAKEITSRFRGEKLISFVLFF